MMDTSKQWDEYFYNICNVVASNSKCFSRKIGCIIVKDKTIIGSGYNGPPRGIPKCDERWGGNKDWNLIEIANSKGYFIEKEKPSTWVNKCPRQVLGAKSGEFLDICLAGHGERNTLINCARMGIETRGCKLYMNCGISCTPCMIEIINSGVEEIIVTSMNYYDKQTKYLVYNSDLKIRTFSHLTDEIGY